MLTEKIKYILGATPELKAQGGIHNFIKHLDIALTEAKESSLLSNTDYLKIVISELIDKHGATYETEQASYIERQRKSNLTDIEILRRALKPKHKKAVLVRDKYRCVNCDSHQNLCVDHKTPLSRGGDNSSENLQTLCRSCNRSKSTKTMSEWFGGNHD